MFNEILNKSLSKEFCKRHVLFPAVVLSNQIRRSEAVRPPLLMAEALLVFAWEWCWQYNDFPEDT